jgi:hypothetical protein
MFSNYIHLRTLAIALNGELRRANVGAACQKVPVRPKLNKTWKVVSTWVHGTFRPGKA